MSEILLKNIEVEGLRSDVLIRDGKIASVLPSDNENLVDNDAVETVDCTGKTAVPGFVNMHTHAGMSMMRGIGEDMAFHSWLEKIWEVESKIDEEYVYLATKLACLEMIKTGKEQCQRICWSSSSRPPLRCSSARLRGGRGNTRTGPRNTRSGSGCPRWFRVSGGSSPALGFWWACGPGPRPTGSLVPGLLPWPCCWAGWPSWGCTATST